MILDDLSDADPDALRYPHALKVRMTFEMREAVRGVADHAGIPSAELVRMLLADFLEQHAQAFPSDPFLPDHRHETA